MANSVKQAINASELLRCAAVVAVGVSLVTLQSVENGLIARLNDIVAGKAYMFNGGETREFMSHSLVDLSMSRMA